MYHIQPHCVQVVLLHNVFVFICAPLCLIMIGVCNFMYCLSSTPQRVLIFILILRNGHREKRKVSPLSTDSWRTRTYLELACQLTDLHSNTEFLLAQAFDFFPMNVVISSFKLPILLCVLRKVIVTVYNAILCVISWSPWQWMYGGYLKMAAYSERRTDKRSSDRVRVCMCACSTDIFDLQ